MSDLAAPLATALRGVRRFSLGVPLLCASLLVAYPWLGANAFWLREVSLIAIFALVVSGLNLSYGYLGDVQLAQAAGFALGAYTAGIASMHWTNDIIVLLLLSGIVAGCTGLILAVFAMRVSGWSLAMMSFFLVLLIPDLVSIGQKWTGGSIGIVGIASPTLFGHKLASTGLYEVTAVCLIVWLLFVRNLVTSRQGHMLRVVRESTPLAASLGISRRRIKLIAHAWGLVPAGIAGCLVAYLNEAVSASTFSVTVAISLLAASILGGAESVYGAVAGAAILQLGPLRSTSFQQYALVVYGGFLIVVAIVLRAGLAGIGMSLLHRLRQIAPTPPADHPTDTSGSTWQIASNDTANCSIEVRGVMKRFGGNVALSDVTLRCAPGQVTALIGANGSGKTTLLNVISGVVRPEEGSVWLGDREITGSAPYKVSSRFHISRTFQTPSVPRGLSVLDAAATGRYQRDPCGVGASVVRTPRYWRTKAADAELARSALDLVGLAGTEQLDASSLSLGSRRFLEIARSLCASPRVLLLDEPASGLAPEEVDRLGSIVRALAEAGVTVVLVEHNFRFVTAIADAVHVLELGSLIFSGTPTEVKDDDRVAQSFLGHAARLSTVEPNLRGAER
jgi:branched-chain amino acid transport system permease protein